MGSSPATPVHPEHLICPMANAQGAQPQTDTTTSDGDSKVPGPSARSLATRRTGLRVVPTRSHRTLQLRRKQPDHVTRHWLASRAGHKPEPWGNPTSTEGKVLGLELQARQSQHNCVQVTLSNRHLSRDGPSCIDRPAECQGPTKMPA